MTSARLALALLLPGVCQAGLEVRAVPAWGGVAAAGAVTEIRVTLLADTPRPVSLEVASAASSVHQHWVLEADIPLETVVSVRADPAGTVAVTATHEGGSVSRNVTLSLYDRGLTASTLDGAGSSAGIALRAADFPATTQAYEAFRTVVIDPATFRRLDAPQAAALAGFARACGRIVFTGAAQAPPQLAASAGCGARLLAAIDDANALPVALARLDDARALPGAPALAGLLDARSWTRTWWTVSAFVVLYCVALVGLARAGARAVTLLWVIVAGSGASFLVGTSGASATTASWSTAVSGDGNHRFATLLRVNGTGRGESAIVLAANSPLPLATTLNGQSILRRGAGFDELVAPTLLFSSADYQLSGARAEPLPLSLTARGATCVVSNHRDVASPPGLLHCNDLTYAVPALAAGQSWQPNDGDRHASDGRPARLWRSQRAAYPMSLLLQLQTDGGSSSMHWLMVVPAAGAPQQ